MKRRSFTKVELGVVLSIIAFLLLCVGISAPLEIPFRLLFGWVLFLGQVGPQIRPDLENSLQFFVAVAALLVGGHYFLAWLYRAIVAQPEVDSGQRPIATQMWRWRWTVSVLAVVLMMFVAGVSMIGVVHQTFWLATGPEPVLANGGPGFAARRIQSANNLHQVGIGFHEYHDVFEAFPPGVSMDPNGRVLHGWQAILLPYLFISTDAIDLSKSWDDPVHTQPLQVPVREFQIPDETLPKYDRSGYALSHYAANQHVIGGTGAMKLDDITDDTANTLLVGEAAGNFKPWGHPRNWRDPMIGLNTSPDGFGGPWPGGGTQFALADGSVKFLRDDIDPAVLRALASPAAGDKVTLED